MLLLRGQVQESPPRLVWYTPGGRLEPGESFEDAARRELTEETGLRDAPIGPLVWTRRSVRRTAAGEIDAVAHFFVVRTASFTVDVSNAETEDILEWRWWTLAELQREPVRSFIPSRLALLVAPLLAGDLPAEPIDASD